MSNPRNHTTSRAILVGLAILAALLISAPSALAAESCPNEQVRHESNINPATGQPYDLALPECRAYEMVSPLAKGGSDVVEEVALPPSGANPGVPVASDGEAVGFFSQNAFGGAENYNGGGAGAANNPYLARRTASGWLTSPAGAPARVIPVSEADGLNGDISPATFSTQSSCGIVSTVNFGEGASVVCAIRKLDGAWVPSPLFPNTTGGLNRGGISYEGSSLDLSHMVFRSGEGAGGGGAYLPTDISTETGGALYEVNGLDSPSPELRLVNVETNGNQIGPNEGVRLGGIDSNEGQPASCLSQGSSHSSSDYHAISESGATVYFTACPSNANGDVNTIYARIDSRETIAISSPSPSQCATCEPTAASAAFEGASADGSKAFFLTAQQLSNADTDHTLDLYEYDFDNTLGKNIVQVSGGGAGDPTPGVGANVQGVVRMSSDGSHVYFVAQGILTTIPNALGQLALEGADNLYVWERNAAHPEGQTRFVAELCSNASESGSISDAQCPATLNGLAIEENPNVPINDRELWGEDNARRAQTTPDGRYLVFDTYAHLITTGPEAELAEDEAQQVYRYDSQTGLLVRVSVGEPSFPASKNGNTPGMSATISSPDNKVDGAFVSINDWGRAISASGSTIAFSTPEQLQASDTNTGAKPKCSGGAADTGCNVYEWHECTTGTCEDAMHGEVNMLSPGNDAESGNTDAGVVGMSESGSDIFLLTRTSLVGQDTDELVDLYDVRVDGGFPAPPAAAARCQGEACQGNPSTPPSGLKPEGTSTQPAGGNLTAPFKELLEPESKPKSKPLTNAQKLKAALVKCRKLKGGKRVRSCEKTARQRHTRKPNSKRNRGRRLN
jgi:hypothetical protein